MSTLPEAAVPSLPTLRILLAEDGLTNQRLALGLLSKWGHQVTLAPDGREALRLLNAATFDLVLMDVSMPEIDGLEATREIRRGEAGTDRHQKIIAMTAHALDADRERCLAAGMDGFVAKPLRRAELMRALLPLFEAAEVVPTNQAVSPAGDIDWESILQGLERDRELLNSVLSGTLEECPGLNVRLERAVVERDGATISSVAHMILGSLRVLDLAEPTRLLEMFEQAGLSGDISRVAASLPRWRAMWKELFVKLEAFVASGTGGDV